MKLHIWALALVLLAMAAATPAQAQDRLQLTSQVKAQLMALTALRDGVEASAFDGRPVLVTFFASWCPPCAAEFGEISRYIESEGSDTVSVIAVNWFEDMIGESKPRLARMLQRIDPSIPVVKGNSDIARSFGGVRSIPAAYIFDAAGREVFRLGGDAGPHGRHYLRREQLAKVIDKLG
jgi:thiol-disulfide isomerase/thioredoxin